MHIINLRDASEADQWHKNANRAAAVAVGNLRLVCQKHKVPDAVRDEAAHLMRQFIQRMYDRLESDGTPLHAQSTGRGAALACVLVAYGLRGEFRTISAMTAGESRAVARQMRKTYFTTLPDVLGFEMVRNSDQLKRRPVLDLIERFGASRKMDLDPTSSMVLWAARKLEQGVQTYHRNHDWAPSVTAAAIFYWAMHRLSTVNDPDYTLNTLCAEWNIHAGHIKAAMRDLDSVFRRTFSNFERLQVFHDLPEQDRTDRIHNRLMQEKLKRIQTFPTLSMDWTADQKREYDETWQQMIYGETDPERGEVLDTLLKATE